MSHPTTSGTGTVNRGTHQKLALAIGAVYLLIGILGFFVTGFDGFAEHNDQESLLGFHVNPLHNVVHLLVGALGVTMWKRSDSARTFGWLLFVLYGLTFIYGLVAAGNEDINFLNINGADNALHLLSALAGLAIALWPRDRDGVRGTR